MSLNYPQLIKKQMEDWERSRGYRKDVLVDRAALRRLYYDWERMEATERLSAHARRRGCSTEQILHDCLRALYTKHHDSERLMLLVMETLKPFIEDRIKAQEMDAVLRG